MICFLARATSFISSLPLCRRSRSDLAILPTLIEPKRHVVHNPRADQRPDMVLTLVSRLCTGWSRIWPISLGLLGSTSNSKGMPMLSYISVYGRTPAKEDSACQGQAWYTAGVLIGA
jgi:hypothetical protein